MVVDQPGVSSQVSSEEGREAHLALLRTSSNLARPQAGSDPN